jgi:peptidylprolyl isomerase
MYAMIVISDRNSRTDVLAQQEAMDRFSEMENTWGAQVEMQRIELSNIHFERFSSFRSEVRSFNAAAVTELSMRDLAIGDGREVGVDDFDYAAYYIGWLADETIFDSSLNEASLKNPLPGGGMIEGWDTGIVGMRIGGVREITMPAHMAYGEMERGEIPANSPLRFIVMLIERPATVPFPDGMVAACIAAFQGEYGEELATMLCEDTYGN